MSGIDIGVAREVGTYLTRQSKEVDRERERFYPTRQEKPDFWFLTHVRTG